MDHYI